MEELEIIIVDCGKNTKGENMYFARCPQMDIRVGMDGASPECVEKELIMIMKANSNSLLKDESRLREELKSLLPYARHIIESGENFKFKKTFVLYNPSNEPYGDLSY